jgi:hypothetical protein
LIELFSGESNIAEVLSEGKGQLIGWHDSDEAREWVATDKSRELNE